MGSMEDICVVCAEPLLWTGLGPCGHKEVCARCVSRVRFVLKDKRCVLCQQESAQVFFTRYMGDYTQRVTGEFFETLQDKVASGEMYGLPAVDGYFDDQSIYKEIKKLCSYTHAILPQNEPHEFSTLQQLKNAVEKRYSREFCSICLQSRKVFICEQLIYTKKELDRHMKIGDETGVLAESGFKGHPLCRFCRSRFYGSEDLYKHMEANHEHCFICRRTQPDKYVYYRHYGELEEHFKKDHHLCPHPLCLEKKFMVFGGEAELKRHFAQEHGDELKMSRSQRREALTLPIKFQYRSGNETQEAGPFAERPGVVIGGGSNVGSRVARRARGGRQEPQLAAALQASMDTLITDADRGGGFGEVDNPSFVTFTASDFPSVTSLTGTTGIASSGRWSGGAAGGNASLNPEEFPSLPTMSRADKRRAKKDEHARKTLAEWLSNAAQQPRVLFRSTDGPSLHVSEFPNLQTASTSQAPTPPAASCAPLTAAPAHPAPAAPEPSCPSAAPGDADSYTAASASNQPAGRAAPPGFPRSSSASTLQRSSTSGNMHHSFSANNIQQHLEEFPTLPSSASNSKKTGAAPKAEAGAGNGSEESLPIMGGVSSSLKAANKALLEKVKQKLLDTELAKFRKRSADFMQGRLSADDYHHIIVDLGLLSLAADMVALCPDPDLRAQLMSAHKEHLTRVAAAEEAGPTLPNGWMPPEAALAAASEAERFTSWACEACTLINAPQATHCEVCGLRKPSPNSTAPSSSKPIKFRTHAAPPQPLPIQAWQPPNRNTSNANRNTSGSTTSNASGSTANHPNGITSIASSSSVASGMDSVVEDFPALVSLDGSHRAAAGAQAQIAGFSDLSASQLDANQPAPAAGSDKKKKKGKQSTSLGTFLQSGKAAPAGWGNTAHSGAKPSGGASDSCASMPSAAVGKVSGAGSAGGQGNPPASKGKWARNGGTKLAKSIGAINEAWGRN